jgi:hypothetical protein
MSYQVTLAAQEQNTVSQQISHRLEEMVQIAETTA